jgi:cytochrome c oxidase cbb3-type subunit III
MGGFAGVVWLTLLPIVAAAQPAATTTPPLRTATSGDIAAGRHVFDAQCAWCHGVNGTGGTGPLLQRPTLRHSANDKSLVDIVRNGIPGTEMPSFAIALTEQKAWQTAAYVRSLGRVATRPLPGDARRGAALYESSGCGSCHIVAGKGGVLGPELTAIGALRGPTHLRESLVNPAATHPPGYLVVRAVTENGTEIRGIRLGEDVFWIHIRDASGKLHVLEKSELSRLDRELEATLMPAYGSRFSATELDDVIAYLASLRGTT